MRSKRSARKRRVVTQYSDEDRERLIREQAQSGLTKKAFCEREGINLGTFHGWRKRGRSPKKRKGFAQVKVVASAEAAIEVLLPNGARIGIRHQGKRDDLIALVRGVAGYRGEAA